MKSFNYDQWNHNKAIALQSTPISKKIHTSH